MSIPPARAGVSFLAAVTAMHERGSSKNGKARPIRTRVVKPLPIPREVPEEPLTPGLKRKEGATAIGFHADFVKDDLDEEYEEE